MDIPLFSHRSARRIIPAFILIFAVSESLPVVAAQPAADAGAPPTAEAAPYFYNLGVNHFLRRDFSAAYDAFSTAYSGLAGAGSEASPFAAVIQYWKAAMLIAMKDDAGARKLVEPLVLAARRPLSAYTSGDIVRALEKVQGPVRMRLLEIETQILGGPQARIGGSVSYSTPIYRYTGPIYPYWYTGPYWYAGPTYPFYWHW
jgi:hypothetical protein